MLSFQRLLPIIGHVGVASVFCASYFSASLLLAAPGEQAEKAAGNIDPYSKLVARDGAVVHWRFSESQPSEVANSIESAAVPLTLQSSGGQPASISGAASQEFPLFSANNQAVDLTDNGRFFRVADPGVQSPLDFDQGDSITLEAWVKPAANQPGSNVYLVGKGRTDASHENQNYALRLTPAKGGLSVGFLFRSRGKTANWHRWTSKEVVPVGDGWHHVVVSYIFGDGKSLKGYIDGVAIKGVWDMGGATNNPPLVDDDEVWIGTSMGVSKPHSYRGGLDEVAIYRKELSAEQVKSHFKYVPPKLQIQSALIPSEGVAVDVYEDLADRKSWSFRPPNYVESYHAPAFGFVALPKKYSAKAIHIDRSNPCLIRAVGKVTIPLGEHRILVRSRNSARLYLDDEMLVETPFHNLGGDNGPVFPIDRSLSPNIHPLHRGDQEKVVTVQGDGKEHVMLLETIVGGNGRRPELGETGVYISAPGEDFRLLGTSEEFQLTDAGWEKFVTSQEQFLETLNLQRRLEAGVKEAEYWRQRHLWAKDAVESQPGPTVPELDPARKGQNWIDNFIGAKLQAAGIEPAPLVDDSAFLRRITLDVTGRMPLPAEIDQYFKDPADQRRTLVIDRLLQSPEWADHWIGYWQDVLAENPNIINPTLNNTGPFRYWIEESFQDNKPFDRFVTELVMMEGSRYLGGPGGFAMASENDAPMATKAHILGEAFLGAEMKCARCHDAPFHDFKQKDLFSLSAMLNRDAVKLPVTSTVPGGSNSLLIEITLQPGDVIEPVWPFAQFSDQSKLAPMLRSPGDTREELALLITSPYNNRFAAVTVNRLWQRYLGYGFVEPVDDWENADPSHPELLEALAREFVSHDYDLKHLARLIFSSATYQRASVERNAAQPETAYLFAAPLQRRLTAEQLVDSLFSVAGKPFDADVMCIDIDTSRSLTLSLDLGRPTRSWQFASLSNERDRPSLALPFAQPFIATLESFGWRSSRQDPLTVRETAPTPLQPAEVANGLLTRRASTLSDDSAFTALAMQDGTVEEFVNAVFRRVLTRLPSPTERKLFVTLLSEDFETRRIPGAVPQKRERLPRTQVAWTNHLDPEASNVKLALESEVSEGDPPTVILNANWRERAEDMIWTLINSPEFIFVP